MAAKETTSIRIGRQCRYLVDGLMCGDVRQKVWKRGRKVVRVQCNTHGHKQLNAQRPSKAAWEKWIGELAEQGLVKPL